MMMTNNRYDHDRSGGRWKKMLHSRNAKGGAMTIRAAEGETAAERDNMSKSMPLRVDNSDE